MFRKLILSLILFLLFPMQSFALTLLSEGTQTATISTEHTIYNSTVNRFYMGFIDLTNMASGDTTELRVKVKVKGAGSVVIVKYETFTGAQTNEPLWYLPPMPSDLEITITLKQTAGTGRAYDFRIVTP